MKSRELPEDFDSVQALHTVSERPRSNHLVPSPAADTRKERVSHSSAASPSHQRKIGSSAPSIAVATSPNDLVRSPNPATFLSPVSPFEGGPLGFFPHLGFPSQENRTLSRSNHKSPATPISHSPVDETEHETRLPQPDRNIEGIFSQIKHQHGASNWASPPLQPSTSIHNGASRSVSYQQSAGQVYTTNVASPAAISQGQIPHPKSASALRSQEKPDQMPWRQEAYSIYR